MTSRRLFFLLALLVAAVACASVDPHELRPCDEFWSRNGWHTCEAACLDSGPPSSWKGPVCLDARSGTAGTDGGAINGLCGATFTYASGVSGCCGAAPWEQVVRFYECQPYRPGPNCPACQPPDLICNGSRCRPPHSSNEGGDCLTDDNCADGLRCAPRPQVTPGGTGGFNTRGSMCVALVTDGGTDAPADVGDGDATTE